MRCDDTVMTGALAALDSPHLTYMSLFFQQASLGHPLVTAAALLWLQTAQKRRRNRNLAASALLPLTPAKAIPGEMRSHRQLA